MQLILIIKPSFIIVMVIPKYQPTLKRSQIKKTNNQIHASELTFFIGLREI